MKGRGRGDGGWMGEHGAGEFGGVIGEVEKGTLERLTKLDHKGYRNVMG